MEMVREAAEAKAKRYAESAKRARAWSEDKAKEKSEIARIAAETLHW